MKKLLFILNSLFFLGSFENVLFGKDQKVILHNDFGESLYFEKRQNPELIVVPDTNEKVLIENKNILELVLEKGDSTFNQAYASVYKDGEETREFAYFGINISLDLPIVKGYLSKKIAFSWTQPKYIDSMPSEKEQEALIKIYEEKKWDNLTKAIEEEKIDDSEIAHIYFCTPETYKKNGNSCLQEYVVVNNDRSIDL